VACGVIASPYAPPFIKNDENLRKLYPPQPLDGLGSGLIWRPGRDNVLRFKRNSR
jgi:hypothetical protein